MTQRRGLISNWWHNYWKEFYTKKMIYHKKIAEYNLYRHNEAIDHYVQKKSNRTSPSYGKTVDGSMGFSIADEGADTYALQYNINWELYIKFRHKLEVMDYETILTPTEIITTNNEVL
jgi:hypothetical protein